jgi:hypothetical protein
VCRFQGLATSLVMDYQVCLELNSRKARCDLPSMPAAIRWCVATCPSTGQAIRGVLNLVDLAGSERVKESGATGQQLKEAQVKACGGRLEEKMLWPLLDSSFLW